MSTKAKFGIVFLLLFGIASFVYAVSYPIYKPPVNNTGQIGDATHYWYAGYFKYLHLNGVDYTPPSALPGGEAYSLVCSTAGVWSWANVSGATLQSGYTGGHAITSTTPVAFTNDAANNYGFLTFSKTPSGAQSGDFVTFTAGANCTGKMIAFTNAGSGVDLYGTSGVWQVTNAGVATLAGLTETGNVDVHSAKVINASPFVFNVSGSATYATTLAVTSATTNKTITLADATGTVDTLNSAAHNYGGAAATWTLTTDEERASYLTMTNANAPAIMQISAAIPGKTYVVYNASTQTITFKVSGQTGVTIANAKTALYVCAGTDMFQAYAN